MLKRSDIEIVMLPHSGVDVRAKVTGTVTKTRMASVTFREMMAPDGNPGEMIEACERDVEQQLLRAFYHREVEVIRQLERILDCDLEPADAGQEYVIQQIRRGLMSLRHGMQSMQDDDDVGEYMKVYETAEYKPNGQKPDA